jgi:hypothetical protein
MLSHFNTAFLGPAFEELVYRGFFVYFVGETVGSMALGVLTGLLLCLWMHLHIGPRKLLSIILFFAATTLPSACFQLLLFISHATPCTSRSLTRSRVGT